MGDSKSKKTFTKLGKLFGVSSSNLEQLHSSHVNSGEGTPIGGVKSEVLSEAARSKGAPAKAQGSMGEEDQENDEVSPLPTDHVSRLENGGVSSDGLALHFAAQKRLQGTSGGTLPGALSGSAAAEALSASGGSQAGISGQHVSPLPTIRSNSSTPVNNGGHVESTLRSLVSSNENGLVHPQPKLPTSTPNYDAGVSSTNTSGTPVYSPLISSRPSSSSGHAQKKPTSTNFNTPAVSASANTSRPGSKSVSRSSSVNTKPVLGKEREVALRSTSPSAAAKPRFRMLDNGLHEHNLKSAKRQEKLSNMIKDLLGAKKLRDEAKSAVPNILQNNHGSAKQQEKPPTLFAGLVTQLKNGNSIYNDPILGPSEQQDCRSFVEKYGRCQEVVGRGSFGVVRVSHKKVGFGGNTSDEMLYAVKEFKRRPNESEKKYNRRLTSEFCISSSLKHVNIIDTLDLLKDAKGDYCEVMEYCSGGDLYTLIIALGKLEYAEADCFFKQLIRGVNYMHNMGVSHRDLKPENLLLTQNGVLKITDFGNGECFKMAWESEIQLSEGICGSSPYIAPEEFTQESFDPRGVDIWACGVIYMAMRTGRQLWKLADGKKDDFFKEYLAKRKDASGYEPIESLKRARCRNVIYSILDPKPERRINGKQILNSEWGREIKLCEAAEIRSTNSHQQLHASD